MNEKAKLIAALRELKDGTVKPEAGLTDEFGEYFGGEQRKLAEPNTKIEMDLVSNLYDHYSGHSNNLEKFEPLLLKLKQEGKYKKFLTPPPGKIFRLLRMPAATFVNLFKTILPDNWKEEPNKIHVLKKAGVLNPPAYKSKVQSWTYSANKGVSSFVTGSNQGEVLLIVVADSNQPNIFLNWQQMKSVVNMGMVDLEKEAISFGPVNYIGLAYCYFDENLGYRNLTKDGKFQNKNSESLLKKWQSECARYINEVITKVNDKTLVSPSARKLRTEVVTSANRLMYNILQVKAPLSGNDIQKINHQQSDLITSLHKDFSTLLADFFFLVFTHMEGVSEREKAYNIVVLGMRKVWDNEMITRDKFSRRIAANNKISKGQRIAGKEIK